MKQEKIEIKGHLQFVKKLVVDVNNLHLRLVEKKEEIEYRELYREAKPNIEILAGIGILALKQEVLEFLEELAVDNDNLDLMGDLIPRLLDEDQLVGAFITKDTWLDVGSTEKYEKINNGLIDEMYQNIL